MVGDLLVAVLVVLGGVFAAGAALGVLRMPDVYIRMHASTKAGTLGVGLTLLGLAVHFGELGVVTRALAAILFFLITAPVAAHMIGRAAYRIGTPLWIGSVIDEFPLAAQSTERPAPPALPDRPAG